MKLLGKSLLSGLAGLLSVLPLAAGTVSGIVRNGTTGAPAPRVEVILLELQGGMQPIATTHSDAQGRYSIDRPQIGQEPLLLRAAYRGVYYHQSLPPGQSAGDIEVFEPTQDAKALEVTQRTIIFQPNGAQLLVGEEFVIQNQTKPPKAFYKDGGTFEFQLPEGAQLSQASAWGPSGMPVVQGTINKGTNRYAVSFPFRPGENGVRFAYALPYASNQATLKTTSPYPAARVLLAAPPPVEVSSDGFTSAGTEQGWKLYTRESVAASAAFVISVSGTAPPPSASNPAGQPSESAPSGAETTTGATSVMPERLNSLRWILIGGFALLFLLGILFLLRRPRDARPAPSASSRAASTAAAQVDREVRAGVEDIKETLFRLELRRQAGTLSEEEYTRERSRAEKTLRDLVKG